MGTSPLSDLAQQERTRREILHRSDLIRPLPDLIVRVLGMLNEGKTEPAELEKHLQVDQVIVAKLLGLVNSPFYGLQRQIKSVREAITVLGFRGLRSLLLASSAAKFLSRDFGCYGHDAQGMLKHSFGVGSAARELAAFVGLPSDQREEVFIGGLLHDIGKMLLVGYLEKKPDPRLRAHDSVCVVERALLGIDHAECGALVATKWNLTQQIQELLKSHHDSESFFASEAMLAVIRVADRYAHERGIGFAAEPSQQIAPTVPDLDLLGLSGRRVDEAKATMERAFDSALESTKLVAG